jgi:hypothetical protein
MSALVDVLEMVFLVECSRCSNHAIEYGPSAGEAAEALAGLGWTYSAAENRAYCPGCSS